MSPGRARRTSEASTRIGVRPRGRAGRSQHHVRRRDELAVRIAAYPPADDGRAGRDGADTKLRAGKIEGDQAGLAQPPRGGVHVAHHRRPGRGIVVGGVDAGDLHAVVDEVGDERRVRRRLRGQRDHDARRAAAPRRTQRGEGVLGEQCPSGVEVDRRRLPGPGDVVAAGEAAQHVEDSVERGEDMRLHPPQRRETEPGQRVLQVAHVVATHRQVVDEVAHALAPQWWRVGERVREVRLEGQRRAAQGLHGPQRAGRGPVAADAK